jgi:hypothetical protein
MARPSFDLGSASMPIWREAPDSSSRELLRPPRAHRQLRFARCCYSHLAGALGVSLLQALLCKGIPLPANQTAAGRTLYVLGEAGAERASRIGFRLSEARASPKYAISCIDLEAEMADGSDPKQREPMRWFGQPSIGSSDTASEPSAT